MPAIGILVPGSTLYPSIGIDLLRGVRSCFTYHQATDITLYKFPIGYGLNDNEIYTETEKFLLINEVDIVIAYADDRLAKILSPLMTAAGKLLIISNAGANYPAAAYDVTHTLFHSLNDCLYSFMTGQYCGRLNGPTNAIAATSYYDGGYQHAHAMTNAFMTAGGSIAFHFISPFKKEAFNINALGAFIQNNPAVNTLLCLYSGDMARCFYEHIAPLQQQNNLQLYGSPMLFDCTPGDFTETHPYVQPIKGYTGWTPSLPNEHNRHFMAFYQKEFGKEANLFSLQGWETALLVLRFLQQQAGGYNTTAAIARLKIEPVRSPRGPLRINHNNAITAPAYLVTATGALQVQIETVIENTEPVWDEMMTQIPDTTFSNWRNTYLCI